MLNKLLSHRRLLIILIIVLSFCLLGLVIFLLTPKKTSTSKPSDSPLNNFLNQGKTQAEIDGQSLSNGLCKGEEKRKLGTLPMKMEDFAFILPYGLMVGDHVTPVDHQYFSPTIFNSPRDSYEVRAMADATIVSLQPRVKPEYTEYRFVFSISCKLFYYYDLVTVLAPDIKKIFDEDLSGQHNRPVAIKVREGQVIGKIGGQTLDFAVWDMDKTLTGFVAPEHYGEPWKIHTVDPLDYYTEDLKKQVLSKYIRKVEPISGKIDYDIDGKAVGNWFVEGTGGYNGQGNGIGYHETHLSLAYNFLDPSALVFSIGVYPGTVVFGPDKKVTNAPMQFGIDGNSPDPKDISVSTGLVKYELTQQNLIDKVTGKRFNDYGFKYLKAKNEDRVEAVALLQMMDDRKLKVEVFPGKTKDQVFGFTSQAKAYER